MGSIPDKLEQISDSVLLINWNNGHEGLYLAEHLRENCPCALCEKQSKASINTDSFVVFNSIRKKGNYALEIQFSDGHTSWNYPYELLTDLCQCDICSGNVIRIQGPFS